MASIMVDEYEYNDLKRRVEYLETQFHQLWRMFHPQMMYQQSIDRIERMIDAENYDEARRCIDGLRHFVGETVELVGVQATLDTITFFKEENND